MELTSLVVDLLLKKMKRHKAQQRREKGRKAVNDTYLSVFNSSHRFIIKLNEGQRFVHWRKTHGRQSPPKATPLQSRNQTLRHSLVSNTYSFIE